MAGRRDEAELRTVENDTAGQLAQMGCTPRHNTVDCPTLFWAGHTPVTRRRLPGGGKFPPRSWNRPSACSRPRRTTASSPSPFGIRLSDRRSGVPVHVDISDEADAARHNHQPQQVRARPVGQRQVVLHQPPRAQLLRAGAHVLLVDTGNSYQGLCGPYKREDARRRPAYT